MPTFTPAGGNTVIEQPSPAFITDGELSTAKRDRMNASLGPVLKHIKNMAERYGSARQGNTNRIAAAQKRKTDAVSDLENMKRDYIKHGLKLTKENTAELDEIIREADEEIAECSKRKFPNIDMDEINRRAARVRNWSRHEKTYFDGDTRHCSDQRKDAKKIRIAKEGKLDVAIQSPRHSADTIPSGIAVLRARAKKGEPMTLGLRQGFKMDYRGEFQPNSNPQIEFPEVWSKPTEMSGDLAMVDDALNFMIWANFDAVAAALEKKILEEADDANAIRDADRPALIATAKAELLEAQRAEEYANKLCERAGLPVFRPYDWPIEVLLEVERPTKTKPVAPVEVADEDAPIDFEKDDDAD
jgi:hypothetical protein